MPRAPITLGNTIQGHINGIELGGTWEPVARRPAARQLCVAAPVDRARTRQHGTSAAARERRAAPGRRLQLFTDIRPDLRLNVMARYVAALPRPRLAGYAEADVTLQWDVRRGIELALTGQNLLHGRHPEFFSGQALLEAYERSFFFTITFRR